jgi:hypothetical protein
MLAPFEGQEHELTIALIDRFDLNSASPKNPEVMNNLLKFFGSLTKRSLKMDSFSQIGNRPQFFRVSDKKFIKDFGLFAWAGYEATTMLCNDGFFLRVDTCTKFV